MDCGLALFPFQSFAFGLRFGYHDDGFAGFVHTTGIVIIFPDDSAVLFDAIAVEPAVGNIDVAMDAGRVIKGDSVGDDAATFSVKLIKVNGLFDGNAAAAL